MGRYRKIPVEIDAFQYRGDRFELQRWMESVNVYAPKLIVDNGEIRVPTMEGNLLCKKDSYVIMGVKGEFYACDEVIFNLTYEKL